MLNKLCVILAAFGAVNWTVLSMYDTDAVQALMGAERTTGTDGLRIIVALAALLAFFSVFKRER